MRQNSMILIAVLQLGLMTLIGTPLLAQASEPESPTNEPSTPTSDIENLLGGPSVQDTPANEQAGMSNSRQSRPQRNRIRLRSWINILFELDFTSDQERAIRTIMTDYQAKMRSFQTQHGAAIRQLTQELAEVQKSQPVNQQQQQELQRAMQKERESAPKQQQYQEQIMDLLNDGQIKVFREKLAQAQALQEQRQRSRRDRAPSDPIMSNDMDGSSMSQPSSQSPEPVRNNSNINRNRIDLRAQRALDFLRAHQSERSEDGSPTNSNSDDS